MKDYEDYLQQQENSGRIPQQLTNKLKPFQILIIIGIFYIISKLVNQGQTKNWVWIGLIILAIIYILSLLNQDKEKKPIPRHIAEIIAVNDIKREIEKGKAFTHGTQIFPTGYFFAEKIDGQVVQYHFGLRIKEPSKPQVQIRYSMNPYPPGECWGWTEMLLGFTGKEIPDVKLLVPERIVREEPEEPKS